MRSAAELGKHDVDEVVDDLVLVPPGAQGDEGAVDGRGVTVAQGIDEFGERLFSVRGAVARCDGSAGRRPGGGDVGDALPCGLSSPRRHRGEQLGSCHEFQRGVQRERVRCLVARDRQQLARGAEQFGVADSVEVPSGPCAGDVVGVDVVERVVGCWVHGSGLLVRAPSSGRDDGPAGAVSGFDLTNGFRRVAEIEGAADDRAHGSGACEFDHDVEVVPVRLGEQRNEALSGER